MGNNELYASFYDKLCKLTPYKDMLKEIYNELDLKSGQTVLDAGCGTGHLCHVLSNNNEIKIIGINNSKEQLNLAQKKVSGKTNVTFKEADLNMPLDMEDNSVDAVCLINVLYMLNKPEDVLHEAYRILKPDGKLVIVNPVSDESLFDIFNKYRKKDNQSISQSAKAFSELVAARVISAIIEIKERKDQFNYLRQEQFEKRLKQFNFRQIRMRMTNGEQALMVIATK